MSLTDQIERATQRIAAARAIAKAVIDGKEAMSLIDKLGLVVERRQDLNKSLDVGADKLLARYAQTDAKAEQAFGKHHARLDAEDAAIDKTDTAIERMSNAAGNSAGSEKPSEPHKPGNGAASDQAETAP